MINYMLTEISRRTLTEEKSVANNDPGHEVRRVSELELGTAIPDGIDGLKMERVPGRGLNRERRTTHAKPHTSKHEPQDRA